MDTLKHKAERAAFGVAIDGALKYARRDREQALLKIIDLAEKFMGDTFTEENYNSVRKMIQDPDNKWVQYAYRALDELDPHVVKTTALNLGFEAFLHGTKTIRKMREVHQCNIPWLILMDPTTA